jgi:hypothetical protein
MTGAYLSPRSRETDILCRSPSPSPSAKPLSPLVSDTTNVAPMSMSMPVPTDSIGDGWEISFDEEDLDLDMDDMSVSVFCRHTKQDGPGGLSLYE